MDHRFEINLTTDAAIRVFEQYTGNVVARTPQAMEWIDDFLDRTAKAIDSFPPQKVAGSALLPLLMLGIMDNQWPEYLFLDV